MRIKKILGTVGLVGNVLNQKSSSKKDAYSCDYINNIVESGSNEKGNWIKFEDGTMICTQIRSVTANFNASQGSLYFPGWAYNWKFPQEFIEAPKSVQGTLDTDEIIGGLTLSGVAYADCKYLMWTATSAERTLIVRLQAIGRWK